MQRAEERMRGSSGDWLSMPVAAEDIPGCSTIQFSLHFISKSLWWFGVGSSHERISTTLVDDWQVDGNKAFAIVYPDETGVRFRF